jgi:ADP-heptose:LPS heptosyltransferase
MHLAGAVGTPCVAIFSARSLPGQWFPRGARNTMIYHQTECFGCGLEVCVQHSKKCLLSITVDEVMQAVGKHLSRHAENPAATTTAASINSLAVLPAI